MRKYMIGQFRVRDERHLTHGGNEITAKIFLNAYLDRRGYGPLMILGGSLGYGSLCFPLLGNNEVRLYMRLDRNFILIRDNFRYEFSRVIFAI